MTGPLRGASNIRITGSANFSFSKPGGSILQLKKDTDAKCLPDLTRCCGINVDNLCFVGNGNKDTSRIVHGIGVFKKNVRLAGGYPADRSLPHRKIQRRCHPF